jgi:hypothetical protein
MLPNLAKSLSGSSPLWLIEKTLVQVGPAFFFTGQISPKRENNNFKFRREVISEVFSCQK